MCVAYSPHSVLDISRICHTYAHTASVPGWVSKTGYVLCLKHVCVCACVCVCVLCYTLNMRKSSTVRMVCTTNLQARHSRPPHE